MTIKSCNKYIQNRTPEHRRLILLHGKKRRIESLNGNNDEPASVKVIDFSSAFPSDKAIGW